MTRGIALLLLVALPGSLAAQQTPVPSFDDPRLQTVSYDPARPVRLVAFANSILTVMLLPGDPVQRATVSDPLAFDVKVVGPGDGLTISPLRADANATLLVDTALRRYKFDLATGEGLAAAYLVRFVDTQPAAVVQVAAAPGPVISGTYRITGEAVLRPSRIGDDGMRTYIEWGEYQSLPAVFGIGANGEEEVVDGYMRNGVFTIDRVYGELVFRIDRKRAKARRTTQLGAG